MIVKKDFKVNSVVIDTMYKGIAHCILNYELLNDSQYKMAVNSVVSFINLSHYKYNRDFRFLEDDDISSMDKIEVLGRLEIGLKQLKKMVFN